MIKIMGFLIIVISSAKIGFDVAKKYSERSKDLKSFLSVLEKIKNEISFSNCVITEALVNASNVKSETVRNMVNFVSDKVEREKAGLSESFLTFTQNNITYFDKGDIEEINGFFLTFGIGDRDDEIKNIENTINNLKARLDIALDDEKRYVKLFRTSGLLAGVLIAIILA